MWNKSLVLSKKTGERTQDIKKLNFKETGQLDSTIAIPLWKNKPQPLNKSQLQSIINHELIESQVLHSVSKLKFVPICIQLSFYYLSKLPL